MNPDFEEIYSKYYQKVKSYISYKVNNVQDSEDLAADVFVKVFEKYSSYDRSKAQLSTWIFTIAKNKVIDYYRKNNNFLEYDDSLMIKEDGEGIISEDNLELLALCLEKISVRERDILILHYYEDKKLKDVAEMLNLSYTYVKILHKKALINIKFMFDELRG